ncbi:hypothetical protein WMF45_44970 [Sorangium sp. So ce448]|uniref:hypothetical protein n=1 Tax=Sorangium sp. So ce448 TaxID=3133314 RepID=UPI003F5E6747
MSVCDLIKKSEVKDLLDRVIPPYQRMLRVPIRVAPRGGRSTLTGTAFDYALRFELQRRFPSACDRGWVAESVLRVLNAGLSVAPVDRPLMARIVRRAHRRVDNARVFVRKHLRRKNPDRAWMGRLAEHALRLARLDPIYRVGYIGDELFAENSPQQIDELLDLLACVPFDGLIGTEILLNPTFGRYSSLVGGADADLVIDHRLIDIKVTAEPNVEREMVRQLIVYLILVHCARNDGEPLPPIQLMQLYFARHGHLWSMPAEPIFTHPAYAEIQRVILQIAGRIWRQQG